MSICLEILLFKLKLISHNQFVRFRRLWVNSQPIEIAFSRCWERRDHTIICLFASLQEIRFQRDSSSTESNLRSGLSQSIRYCGREVAPVQFIIVLCFERNTFVSVNCQRTLLLAGVPVGEPLAVSWLGFSTYSRVQYLFFTHILKVNQILLAIIGYLRWSECIKFNLCLSACLYLQEIRIQRDSRSAENNFRSGFRQSIGTAEGSSNRFYLSEGSVSIETHLFFCTAYEHVCQRGFSKGSLQLLAGQEFLYILEYNP